MRAKKQEEGAEQAFAPGLDLGAVGELVSFWLSVAEAVSLTTFVKMVGGQSRNARYIILALIRQNPGVTQTQLSVSRFRDASSMSPVIAEFLEEGLVRRERVFVNKRPSKALFLTEKGEEAWQGLHAVALQFIGNIERILGTKDHREMARLLKKLSIGLIELDEDLKRQV